MKISERPFSLPFAAAKDDDLKPSGDGMALYQYVCLKCWYVELYTSRKVWAVKLRELFEQGGDGDSTDTKTGTQSKQHFASAPGNTWKYHWALRQYFVAQYPRPSRRRDILQLDFFHHLVEFPDEFARSQGWRTHALLTATNERQPPAAILDRVRVKDGSNLNRPSRRATD